MIRHHPLEGREDAERAWVITAASAGRLSTTLKSSWLDSRPHAGTLMSSRSTS